MKTIAQLLRELKSVQISEGILETIADIEKYNLERAYDESSRVPFEQWHEATFDK